MKVFNNYIDFADILSSKLAIEFLKHTQINNDVIELIDD